MKYLSVVLSLPFDGLYTYFYDKEEVKFGVRVIVPFGKREMTGFVVSIDDNKPEGDFEIKSIKRVVDKEPVFNQELYDLAKWMSTMYLSSVGENLSMMIPSGRRESEVSSFFSPASFSKIETLTHDQERALSILREKDDGLFYIYGVTGSGKSEVYLRRAEDFIQKGKQVLYLVPEITLSHQISNDVYNRFEGKVAILHSSLTPSQRLKAWNGIMRGDISIVIGARSSVFAPFKDLGLIILDEEHDSSYKSGNTPRYHARQVAQHRAGGEVQMIMGSATPSLEAWKLILDQKVRSISMPNRIGEGRFPEIKVVNILKEKRNISSELESEIRSALREKKGIILFLNRRGYSYNYACNTCGEVITCPNCSVSLTYHKKTRRLKCHTCGYSQPLVDSCPTCQSKDLSARGFGTENVEEEVASLFPGARVARLDTDIAEGDKEKVKEIIDAFREGEIDILLGTQMIAKGLNFPKVSLVGILNADSSLNLPDFRAAERTFSLLHQVAGRAGRFRADGKVVIQTSQPLTPAIRYASLNDLEEFYRIELQMRKSTIFPPYSRLINLTIRGKNEDKVRMEAEQIEKIAYELEEIYDDVEVFPASPCLIEKQAMNYRYHVLLRCGNMALLLHFARELLARYKAPSSMYLEIDVDPQALL